MLDGSKELATRFVALSQLDLDDPRGVVRCLDHDYVDVSAEA
jgi:hypothetical protein